MIHVEAGVVNQHINCAKLLHDTPPQRQRRCRIRKVSLEQGVSRTRQLRQRGFSGWSISPIMNRDTGAALRELRRNHAAYAAGSAGDEGDEGRLGRVHAA